MPQLAIVADDMTGAADTGAPFAEAGFVTLLIFAAGSPPMADVLTLSTESRHLPPDRARVKVQQAARRVRTAGWIYKKIDSTLRGSPAAELAAMMDTLRLSHALVVPAFPAQGRTTVMGRQLIGGVPLDQSTFADEVACSDLLQMFSRSGPSDGPPRPVHLVDLSTVRRGVDAVLPALSEPGILIADAETDADLSMLAQAAVTRGIRLFCGSAGLAYALVRALPMLPTIPSFILPRPMQGPALAVVGSRNARSIRQVEVAAAQGATVVTPPPAFVGNQSELHHVAAAVREALASGRPTILTTATMPISPLGSRAVAQALGGVVHLVAQERLPGVLIVTGGDVATAVVDALAATCLWLQGEIQAGIPWGILLDGLLPGVRVVTKAGGFGTDEALALAIGMASAQI